MEKCEKVDQINSLLVWAVTDQNVPDRRSLCLASNAIII